MEVDCDGTSSARRRRQRRLRSWWRHERMSIACALRKPTTILRRRWGLNSDDIRKSSVFSAYWFDTGYMSTSVYGGLVSLVPRSCRQRQLVLLVSTHFALCFLLCSQALMSCIMAGMDQKDFLVAPKLQFVKVVPFSVVSQRVFPVVQLVWPTTEVSGWSMSLVCSRAGFCAAAVHQRGRLHPCRCAEFIPWSGQLSDLGIPSCCTRWSTSLFPGRAGSLLVVAQWLFPMVQTARRTIETSQLQYALDG